MKQNYLSAFPFDHRFWKGGALLFVLTFFAFYWHPLAGWICLSLFIFHLAFFRIPKVNPKSFAGPLAPSYGKVVDLEEVMEERFLKEPAIRIGIFLSVLDPHITLSPIQGKITYLDFVPGKFINALRRDSALKNESNWIGIQNDKQSLVVRQITGAIARRIFWDISLGDSVEQGEKIGVICYGSRVECYIPKRFFRTQVKLGDYVRGGETLLGAWI